MTADVPTSHLPAGLRLRRLTVHRDQRGALAELFRNEWDTGARPLQWNMLESEAGTFRGVHLHARHDDYLTVLQGRASIGVRDLRAGSPSEGRSALLDVCADADGLVGLTIPHGVAHGLYFHHRTVMLLGVSHYWDVQEEFGCHWTDPALEIPWPATSAIVSERDAALPPLKELLRHLPPLGA